MIGIVDYNAGNIKSVSRALDFLSVPHIVSKNPSDLENVDRLIFPGVGEASYAMKQLSLSGFDSFLKEWALSGKPLLGICLGSQIIFDYSEEGDVQCLSLIRGKIRHFSVLWNEAQISSDLKIPQMGWNDVTYCNGGTKLCATVEDKSDFYFVHSYVIQADDSQIVKGYTNYGVKVPAIIESGAITAFQFHPEKSGEKGLQLLRNFVTL